MRAAWAALKHTYEKVGDRWMRKDKARPVRRSGDRWQGNTPLDRGGVDANASKKHLYEVTQDLGSAGRSKMSKKQVVDAICEGERSPYGEIAQVRH